MTHISGIIENIMEKHKEQLLSLPFTAERSARVDQIDYIMGALRDGLTFPDAVRRLQG